MKVCKICGKSKPLTDFSPRKKSIDGYRNECKVCIKNNKCKTPYHTRAASSYYSHKQRGHILELSISDIEHMMEQTKVCPICGNKMITNYGNGHNHSNPTLDRINNELILTKNNTWIICHRCNLMKADLTMNEYVEHCKIVVKNFGEV